MALPAIRTAVPSDYDRIVAVMDDWWGRPVRAVLPRLFLDHFAPTSLAADEPDGGALAGFLVGFLSPSRPREAYIHFAGVSPRHRRAGLARRLYGRFCDLARGDGRRTVRAITPPHNEASIAFHSALGFTVTGPVRDYHGPGADRILFELDLSGRDWDGVAGPGAAARLYARRYAPLPHLALAGPACGDGRHLRGVPRPRLVAAPPRRGR